jgi:hypothetical protein
MALRFKRDMSEEETSRDAAQDHAGIGDKEQIVAHGRNHLAKHTPRNSDVALGSPYVLSSIGVEEISGNTRIARPYNSRPE